jgi:hypothetical protein
MRGMACRKARVSGGNLYTPNTKSMQGAVTTQTAKSTTFLWARPLRAACPPAMDVVVESIGIRCGAALARRHADAATA